MFKGLKAEGIHSFSGAKEPRDFFASKENRRGSVSRGAHTVSKKILGAVQSRFVKKITIMESCEFFLAGKNSPRW